MKPVRAPESSIKDMRLEDYILEPKFDGHRAMVVTNGNSKTGLWTRQGRPIAIPTAMEEALQALQLPAGTVLDGEIWNPSKRGGWKDTGGDGCRLTLWDCVRHGACPVGPLPLEERRSILESLIGGGSGLIGLTEVKPASMDLLDRIKKEATAARASGQFRSGFIHGVVMKLRGSPRHDHPTRSVEHANWIKVVFWN